MYHGSMCVALCVEPMLEVEGEGGKKNTIGKPRKIETCQILKKSDGWKEIIKKDEKIIF